MAYLAILATAPRLSKANKALSDALLRIDRADEHLTQLSGDVANWVEENREKVAAVPEMGGTRIRLVSQPMQGPDPKWSIVIGEVVYNLRAALDYLVYALALLDSGRHQKDTQFPIAERPEAFGVWRTDPMAGLRDRHIEQIRALQPFNGNEWLLRLQSLSNRDKHWALTVTVPRGTMSATFLYSEDAEDTPREGREVGVEHERTLELELEEDETPVLAVLEELAREVRAALEPFRSGFQPSPGVWLTEWVQLAMTFPNPFGEGGPPRLFPAAREQR